MNKIEQLEAEILELKKTVGLFDPRKKFIKHVNELNTQNLADISNSYNETVKLYKILKNNYEDLLKSVELILLWIKQWKKKQKK